MNIAVIFAGGAGKRMHSKEKPKQFLDLHQKPIIAHTLQHFEDHPLIDAIVIACIESGIETLKGIVEKYNISKVKKIVQGGETGQDSIYAGLLAAREASESVFGEHGFKGDDDTIVLIHDGVRPMIDEKLITDNINSVEQYGSAITTGVVTETILVVNEETKKIKEVPSRDHSRVAKAPQSFFLKDILSAHERAISEGRHDFIDSCTMMKHYGYDLSLVDGTNRNIKITTREDYYLCRTLLQEAEDEQFLEMSEIRG